MIFARIRSYISTSRKNKIQILDSLRSAIAGNAIQAVFCWIVTMNSIKKIKLYRELKDSEINYSAKDQYLEIQIIFPDGTIYYEKYIYENNIIKTCIIEFGIFKRIKNNFKFIKRYNDRHPYILTMEVLDEFNNQKVKNVNSVEANKVENTEVEKNFKIIDIDEFNKIKKDYRNSNVIKELKKYRINFLQRINNKQIYLYGFWRVLDVEVNYIFGANDCNLGVLTGSCTDFYFDNEKEQGGFIFLNYNQSNVAKFEYKIK